MSTKIYDKKRLQRASISLAAIFICMLFFSILAWGTASSWGSVNISRVSFVGESGAIQSGLMFVPKGVSPENPAPAIINYHGRNCSSNSMVNWAIEEARRGYIVLNPDLSGTNETENTVENTTANICLSAYKYLDSLDIVKEISATGHSMGNVSLNIIMRDKEIVSEIKSIVGVGGFFFWKILPGDFPSTTNYYIIEGTADLYEEQWFGDKETMYSLLHEKSPLGDSLETGKLYGDPSLGTAFSYIEEPVTHQQMMYNKLVIGDILDCVALSSPAPNSIDNSDMVFRMFQFYSAVCTVLFILFVASFSYTLTCMPLFYSVVNVPLKEFNGHCKKHWIKQISKDFAIPLILFVPITKWAATASTKIFVSEWVNQIFFWITSVAIVGAILSAIKCIRKAKTTNLTAADFGTGTEEEKAFNIKRILAALTITLIAVFVAFTWMDLEIKIFGVNYQFYCLLGQINRVTPERLVYIIPYLLVCIFLVFVINMSIATSRRMRNSGNETRDMIRDIIVNAVLSAGPLTLLMAIEFIGIRIMGTGAQPFSSEYFGSLSFGFMFPLMMTSSAAISTFLYKKTGNTWTGVFTSSFTLIFITILNCCCSAIVIA